MKNHLLLYATALCMLTGCVTQPSAPDAEVRVPAPSTFVEEKQSESPRNNAEAVSPSAGARTKTQAETQSPAPPPPSPSPSPTPALREAAFSTELPPSSANRVNNLKTVTQKLDGFVIRAGKDFSFNRDVGPRTVKAGYRKATAFVNKKEVEVVGGGICQLSTTLYNAALALELPIKERHPHHKKVAYIEKGKDATVSYGSLDLIFENNTPYDIVIHCGVDKEKVSVKLNEVLPEGAQTGG